MDKVTLQRCKIQNNIGENSGASIYGKLYNCLVTGNKTEGALFGSSTVLNSTIAKNTMTHKYEGQKFSESSKYYNCVLWENYSRHAEEEHGYYDPNGKWVKDEDEENAGYDDEYGNWVDNGYQYQDRTVAGPKKIHNVDSGNTYKNTDKTNKNPKLTSAYKPKKGSYVINKGKLTSSQKKLVGDTDLAGKKRIKGKAIDCGCYEY